MLAYATLGTRDLARAAAFYDAVLAPLGAKRFMEEPDYFIAWGNSEHGAGLGITYPFDKQAATVGNGCMVALGAASREQVDAVHAKALELGGSDEGAPGLRDYHSSYYAAFLRDPDGNRIEAVCHAAV